MSPISLADFRLGQLYYAGIVEDIRSCTPAKGKLLPPSCWLR